MRWRGGGVKPIGEHFFRPLSKEPRTPMQPATDHAGKPLTKNAALLQWVEETARLTKPDRVVWCDGSEEEKHRLTEEAVAKGMLIPLNHDEAARAATSTARTRTTSRASSSSPSSARPRKDEAGPTNNWMAPDDAYRKLGSALRRLDEAAARCTWSPTSWARSAPHTSKVGVELTDSIYVVLNMRIMTRMGRPALEMLGDSQRLQPRPALDARLQPGAPVHLPLPPGQHDLERRQRLRRQRAPRQEVPRAPHRQLPRHDRRAGSPSTC